MSPDPARVDDELAHLAAAVRLVAETQATQTELLRLILEAATAEHPAGDVHSMLSRILEGVERLNARLADGEGGARGDRAPAREP